MLGSAQFRELLVADVALVRGVANARDVAAALQRYWDGREKGDVSLASELQRIAGLAPEALAPVLAEVDRLIEAAAGDSHAALTMRGGLDRSLHVALPQHAAQVSRAMTQIGAGVHAPLRPLAEDRYIDFLPAGEGGMGLVYMALDTELNRLIAFKMVRPDVGSGRRDPAPTTPVKATPPLRDTPASAAFEELKERFLQEAWITGGMEHPGVVPVYELGRTTGGVPYYTMRFVRGQRTLKDAIDEVREAPVDDRLSLLEAFLKLADTVRYAHSRGVIHRDLKPENVALGQFGEVVLLDWGLAKLEGSQDLVASRWQERVREFREAGDLRTVAGSLGTPGYMSPEAALGRIEQVDATSDVYSLGVVLFEILTGQLPFRFRTYAEYLDGIARQDPPLVGAVVADVPQALSELCASCLARDRAARPESVDALAAALRSWQVASAVEREVQDLVRDARAALAAAEAATAEGRLKQVDRAQAALQQAAGKQPGNEAVIRERRRANGLREQGIHERERASGRRLLARVGVAALVLATMAGFVIAAVINAERAEKQHALEQVEEERDAKTTALGQAEAERDAKTRALAEVERLADSKEVRDLVDQAERLWPRLPERAPAMAAWIERAKQVLEGRPVHETAVAALCARALPYSDEDRERDHAQEHMRMASVRAALATASEERAKLEGDESEEATEKRNALDEQGERAKALATELEERLAERRTWRFADDKDAWKHDVLTDLLAGMTKLAPPGNDDQGLLEKVRQRHAFASTLRQRSIEDHADLWIKTIAELVDEQKHPAYNGLSLTPQLGLVPLGPDPDSGLFEFAHLGSGTVPLRDPKTQRLGLEDASAIVMVLIPTGTFLMGAQKEDPQKPNYDPQAGELEGPVHAVTLSPYFVAKHECTQAQWIALTGGTNPSVYAVGKMVPDGEITARHPVENVSWMVCTLWTSRNGLSLPSEAQWEHACRGGSDAPWFTGREIAALGEVANIADRSCKERDGPTSWTYSEEVQDGRACHAPVGIYKPNAFGLHDMHGNVIEWCIDGFGGYALEPSTDPVNDAPGYRAHRGGGWCYPALQARSAYRWFNEPGSSSYLQGLRPARLVTTD